MILKEFNIIGWDVGGAHLKAVLIDDAGKVLNAVQIPCPLWQGLDKLHAALDQALNVLGHQPSCHAVTMTGELADIFMNRCDGVSRICELMYEKLGSETLFYAGQHGLITLSGINGLHSQVASANWHASACFVAGKLGQGLFIDIGSTTADLILLSDRMPVNRGFSDAERMREDELVYTGIVRTPLMALTQTIEFNGHEYRIAAEHFATTADIYRITGELMEADDMASTADGAEKSVEASMRRLARMLGHDKEDMDDESWGVLAQSFKARQLQQLEIAVSRLLQRGQLDAKAPLIAAGAGGFLVEELAQRLHRDCVRIDSLIVADSDEIRRRAGICFPAYSVACLMH